MIFFFILHLRDELIIAFYVMVTIMAPLFLHELKPSLVFVYCSLLLLGVLVDIHCTDISPII